MRTLFLLRHAKSSWADPALADHERPLAPRGRRAARRIAEHLRSEAVRPALVLCSSARRARETFDALEPVFSHEPRVQVDDELYEASARQLVHHLRAVDEDVPSVMIVGHNPALQDLALLLAGDGEPAAMAQLRLKFPTGALATLDLGRAGWHRLARGQAYLAGLVLPKQLG